MSHDQIVRVERSDACTDSALRVLYNIKFPHSFIDIINKIYDILTSVGLRDDIVGKALPSSPWGALFQMRSRSSLDALVK